MLREPELEQLAQRVIARYHLDALTEPETIKYLRHRLAVAGLTTALPFSKSAMQRIHQRARGVPRRINLLADRALLGAYAEGAARVDERIVDKAATEVFGREERLSALRRAAPWGLGLAAGAAVAAVVAWALWPQAGDLPAAPVAAASAVQRTASGAVAASAAAVAAVPNDAAAVGLAASAAGTVFLKPADITARLAAGPRAEAEAWRELAPRYGLVLPDATSDPCTAVQRAQWQCFRSPSGGLPLIRQLDRPGVITLRDEAGRAAPALLVGLDDKNATLAFAQDTLRVTLVSLANVWQGDFMTYWRAPEGYAGVVTEGASGPAVDLLAAQLAAWRGEPVPAGTQRFDSALRAKVQAFQLAQGLRADGRAGPTTYMQLARAAGSAREPRLNGNATVAAR
jgi:general secretion pathway protein A